MEITPEPVYAPAPEPAPVFSKEKKKPDPEIQKPQLQDKVFLAGLLLVGISAALFCIPLVSDYKSDTFMGFFFAHYLFAAGYMLVLFIKKLWYWRKKSATDYYRYLMPFMVLSLISAFALNRDLVVFQSSVSWLSIMLTVQCITLLGLAFANILPKKLLLGLVFILGAGFPLFVYLTLSVAPLYLISMIGVVFFGISLHTFVPVLFVIGSLTMVMRCARLHRAVSKIFIAGSLTALAITAVFAMEWYQINKTINQEYKRNLLEEQELPAWVRISQKLPQNFMSAMALKGNMVYQVFNPDSDWLFGFPGGSFWEERKHDPLMVVATFFTPANELGEGERIKILKSLYDARHNAEERLWSGENLKTTQVITNVKLWPEYRMAYTEKILSIRNTAPRTTWLQTEEALYTFHLPEGSAVSSLSLWINDIEEKGYLTSKQVADSAYKTIVGREARDPSLVHWQEGNKVTVRVFPVTPAENRRVKIGITSPLQLNGDQLVYKNIYFDGPGSKSAEQLLVIDKGTATGVKMPFAGSETADGKYEYEGSYQPDWQITAATVPLAAHAFSFQNKTYQLEQYRPALQPVQVNRVYLDLHSGWTLTEIQQVLELAKGKKVYAWTGDKMVTLSEQDPEQVHKQTSALHYSLFPLYLIKDPANSLLVTKGAANSPNLSDLAVSRFYSNLIKEDGTQEPVKAFCLTGAELSPYQKTLCEFRLLQLVRGSQEELAGLLRKNQFPARVEDENKLLIEPAGMLITEKDSGSETGQAPDHLYRLFAYNTILRKAGTRSIQKDFTDTVLVHQAQLANIVSPLSSLIVLETQNDYDRFDIKNVDGSLGNASMRSSGAVPEPHEWALIILVGFTAVYFLYKQRIKQLWAR